MNRLIGIALLSAALLAAQPRGGDQADPPSRVARLNWISGDVAFQPATVDSWTNATLNYPLTTGDHIYVNDRSRVEMHIDGSAIRLNSNSNFGFLNLDDNIVQMSLSEGSLEMRLRQLDQNDTVEIDTPNGAITLLRAGDYRVDTDSARNVTMVTVRSGQAEVYQDGNSQLITAHQTVWFHDGGGPEVSAENARDDFDGFAMGRDDAEDRLPRHDYVPETMVGYEDLYAYGRWANDPGYGWVWVPPVGIDWSPYSTGRWAFVEPWGWTWIDDAPWGFAPFHYGRWARIQGGWGWIPGERVYRPVYAPALVGFIGGGGFGLSIGWFPLGPREPWIPAWGASRGYVNRVNVMHVTNINVINVNVTKINYVNRQHVTAVSQTDFAAARPVRAAAIRVAPGQLQGAVVLGANPQVVPMRASVAVGAVRAAPPLAATRVVVAKTAPPPPPVSFQARQQALAQNRGLPLNQAQVREIRSQQPAAVVARPQVRAIAPPQAQPQPAQAARPGFRQPPASVAPGQTPAPAQSPAPIANPNRFPDRMNSRPSNIPPMQQAPAPQPQQQQQQQRFPAPQREQAPPVQAAPQRQQNAPAPVQAAPAPPRQVPQREPPPMQPVPQRQQMEPVPAPRPAPQRQAEPAPHTAPPPQQAAPARGDNRPAERETPRKRPEDDKK